MEDPTTLAINLTYLGTLGLAVVMFLGLMLIVIITLVIAGVGRLLSIILLALVGIFPKKANTPIVHLPQHPGRAPDLAAEDDLAPVAVAEPAADAEPAAAGASAAVAAPAAAPKRDFFGGTRRRISGASSALKDGAWKAKVDPRNLPKPAEVKSVVEHQTAHHPIVVAAAKEPPVLSKDWADAVAQADERAAARAKAQQPPAIKVTVRDLDEPTPPPHGKTPAPKRPDVPPKRPDHGPAQAGDSKNPALGNGAKKSGPDTSKNGKSPSPIRKGSLSGASRNS
ncbi:hypothetical protein [Paenarthrobacter aurescens]|uniref:Uncharacterized protein n=1 Tax=Paenarthrobacter aurescens TaxID=43663 RepID=A0A4Y3NPV7_PAEAU|nr:hypothetical protein [Paenarthrobacter aurescens]MDO6145195.1 hypothetical protein [Paenarthrobacter aurescens]MDO6149040.1 hypothetical protein [Paenarthrobacter aurescens]MDO6160286.1 hypothetical protein [Paenarthrobacter aurescens]MDO6164145.1 hypothetical protein [Paenarthrobacter aurescens]GEB21038.1 hypothetical protein AAU01_37930 [Paenarthrobacter aurescens]